MKWGFLYNSLIFCLLSIPNLFASEWQKRDLINSHIELKSYYHPIHISYTNIEFNQKTNQFDILIKLFVDDFELILNRKYGKNINLANDVQSKVSRETIDKYILEHFKLIMDGKDKTKSSLKLGKIEIKELSIWLNYSFSFNRNCNTFDISNSLMTDLFQDQTNLLIFSYNDEQKAFKFNASRTKEKLTF